jgi:hypothetical protein
MNTSRHPFLIFALAAALALVTVSFSSCSRQSASNINIQLINAPSTLTVNQAVNLTASVANDSSNAGVDWSCGGSGNCGTFNPVHTANGGTTVYTAPSSVGTVTLTAAATANGSIKSSATISIVPVGSNPTLNGPYVFSVQGYDSYGSYAAAGTIVADGNGHITGGEQDYSDTSVESGPDAVTGSYSIGPDGRGSLTLNASDTTLPNNGVETLSVAVTSTTHALIIQFDGSATSSGTLDVQAASATNPSAISGSFAFTAQGADVGNQVPITFGGLALMSTSSGSIAGATFFENDAGSTSTSSLTGSITAPDALGRGTIGFSNGVNFAYYAIQGQVLRLVEKDAPVLITGGSMYGQGAAGASASFSNASLSGNYVLSEAGASVSGSLALAGQFSADGAGNLTAGVADTNDAGVATFGPIAGQAVYSIAGTGTGTLALPGTSNTTQDVSSLLVFVVDPTLNLLDPNSTSGGGGALVMDYDSSAVGSGFILPRSSGAFQGNYAVNLSFVDTTGETDWVGQSVVTGGGLTGTVDVNADGVTTAGVSLSGTFTADASDVGRWIGTLALGSTNYSINCYQVSGTLFVIIDTDSADIGTGILESE